MLTTFQMRKIKNEINKSSMQTLTFTKKTKKTHKFEEEKTTR